jgi:hypothetical protein
MSQSRTTIGRHERRIWGWGGVVDHEQVKREASERIRAGILSARRHGAHS